MLNTLVALGKEIAQQQGEWDNLVEIPKFEEKNNDEEPITNYVLIVTFDVDEQTINFKNGTHSFGVKTSSIKYRNINSELWGRRGDPWMVTCTYPKKLPILQKSIFGKPEEDIGKGLFQKSLLRSYPDAKDTLFYRALEACYSLRNVQIDRERKGIDVLVSEYISEKISLPRNHKIVLLTVAIKAESLGIIEPTLLCQLDGYDLYIKRNFSKGSISVNGNEEKLCYVTGKRSLNVALPTFPDREDMNNIFVTTTINYASNFEKKAFTNNYQIDIDIQKALRNGSNYIRGKLNNQRCSVRIANTEHFIIPVFLKTAEIDLKFELDNIQKLSEWVFTTKQLDNLIEGLGSESGSALYWINYIAYASDGNSVKVINHIKDVSSVWFHNIIQKDIEQSNLISTYFNQKRFNLSTIYYSIPIRKDHEKKNDALKLLSQILEQRKISKQKLFNYFTELILCHYYNRYRSYSNIPPQPERFDYAIRDGVLKYQFLINLLKSLNLTDMDMEEIEKNAVEGNDRPDKLKQFFEDMGYSHQQQSLYWLGRIVWRIGKAQMDKDHKQMPVLNKISYNGMDYSKIQRLFIDSFELATQYRVAGDIKFYSNMFQQNFPGDLSLWKITPQEAVFYILSGFSLYINNNEKQ